MDAEHGALCRTSCLEQQRLWLPRTWYDQTHCHGHHQAPGSAVVTRHITGHYCHQQTETDCGLSVSRLSPLSLHPQAWPGHPGQPPRCELCNKWSTRKPSGRELLVHTPWSQSLLYTRMNRAPVVWFNAFSPSLYTTDITTLHNLDTDTLYTQSQS